MTVQSKARKLLLEIERDRILVVFGPMDQRGRLYHNTADFLAALEKYYGEKEPSDYITAGYKLFYWIKGWGGRMYATDERLTREQHELIFKVADVRPDSRVYVTSDTDRRLFLRPYAQLVPIDVWEYTEEKEAAKKLQTSEHELAKAGFPAHGVGVPAGKEPLEVIPQEVSTRSTEGGIQIPGKEVRAYAAKAEKGQAAKTLVPAVQTPPRKRRSDRVKYVPEPRRGLVKRYEEQIRWIVNNLLENT